MKTILEMRQKLFKLYSDSIKKYSILEYSKVRDEMAKEIRLMNPIERREMLSLMTVYTYEYLTTTNDLTKNEKTLYSFIKTKSKDTVLESLFSRIYPLLDCMIDLIIKIDLDTYVYPCILRGQLEDFEHYKIINKAQPDSIFYRYHPDPDAEKRDACEYRLNEKILSKERTITPNNLADFVQIFLSGKQLFTRKIYKHKFLMSLINNIDDEELLRKINLFMIKNYYIDGIISSKTVSERKAIEDIVSRSLEDYSSVNYLITDRFSNYKLGTMLNNYNSLSDTSKNKIKEMK